MTQDSILARGGHFFLLENVQGGCGAQPPGVLSQGVKQVGHEADHLPPSTANGNNEQSYSSLHNICLHAVDRDSLTFSFTYAERVPLYAQL